MPTGGGRLASVTNNVISNSAIAYTYDALGRTTNRSINTSSNSITWTYDQISRITAEANQLGTTNYTYVDNTSGSSKGVYRLASTALPNTQVTNFNWYPNIADQRLQQITNLGHTPSPPTLSSFSYAYDAAGEITQWQQSQNATNTHLTPGYDLASQLTSSPSDSGSTTTTYIGGTVTTGNTLTLTAYDPALSGGQEAVNYTVVGGDTTTSIATALTSAINADSNLTGIGVSATSSNSVITITSSASHATSFYGTLSSGATETIAIVPSNSKTPTINNYAYTYNSGSNRSTATIGATTTTYNYNNVNALTSITGGPTLTYDSNGNLTNDGTNTYAWDAENRLIQITYPGSGNNSQYTYDAFGHCVKIVETTSGTITSTKQFVWCNGQMCEARDASSTITAQYFSQGETISGTDYYYTKDHLGSIRELTDSSGTIQSQYTYDPYGQVAKIAGTGPDSDFQYAGYYYHARSGMNLTMYRAYNANLGRWINRDPLGEISHINMYQYANNNPMRFKDPLGLLSIACVPPDACKNPTSNLCICLQVCARTIREGIDVNFADCLVSCINTRERGRTHSRYNPNEAKP